MTDKEKEKIKDSEQDGQSNPKPLQKQVRSALLRDKRKELPVEMNSHKDYPSSSEKSKIEQKALDKWNEGMFMGDLIDWIMKQDENKIKDRIEELKKGIGDTLKEYEGKEIPSEATNWIFPRRFAIKELEALLQGKDSTNRVDDDEIN